MKKLVTFMGLMVLCLTSSAQVEKIVLTPSRMVGVSQVSVDSLANVVPSPIVRTLASLKSKYQDWNLYTDPASAAIEPYAYMVNIKGTNGAYQTMFYDAQGNLLRTKQTLKNPELPDEVKNKLASKYADWQLLDSEEQFVSRPNNGAIRYKLRLKKGLLKKTVFIEPDGNIKLALLTV